MRNRQSLVSAPKPYENESLAGYILRLTEGNFYKKVSEIYRLSDLWETVKGRSKNGNLLNPLTDNMEKLSKLLNCSVSDLIKMTFASNDVNSSFFHYRNQPIPREAIHTTKTKICPECLAETAYHRQAWDLVAVTVCVKHQKVLIDKCPNCSKDISWSRAKILECSCGQLLSEIPSKSVPIWENSISILFSKSNSKYLKSFQENPLIHLNLLDLYEILVFFSWYLPKKSNWKLRNKYIGKSLSNQEIHQLFSSVFNIFNNWPKNYIEFLDNIQESSVKQEDKSSMEDYFGYFYTALYKHLDNKNTKFIIDEFDEYLAKRWDGGYIANLRKSSSKKLNKKFIAASEVAKMYGIALETVKKYISKGIFQGVIKKRGNTTLILVEKVSVEKYKQGLQGTLSTKETSNILGVSDRTLNQLHKYDCIEALRGPKLDGYPQWRYCKKSVYGLLEKVHKKVPSTNRNQNNNDSITFRIALQIAGSFKFGIGQLVKGILDDYIKPVGIVKGEGLNQFKLLREEVRDYFLEIRSKEDNEYITLNEMVKITGVKRENIADWMKRGFLSYVVGGREEYKSTRKEFDRFLKTYVPLSIASNDLSTNSKSLYQKLLSNKIVALTGPRVDGGRQYLYLKEAIDNYIDKVRKKN